MTNTASDNKEQIVFVDRRDTDSSKWDNLKSTFGRSDLQAMWIADMDFRVPDCVVSAIEDYMKTGVFGYYVPRPSYHQAFIDWERKYHGYQVKEEWLRFAPGVVPAFNWFLQVFTEPGDAVIVQTPVYYPFMHAVKNNSRRLVCCDLINTGGIYTVDFADFEKKIVENGVKLFILSSPHNPAGRVWKRDELKAMLDQPGADLRAVAKRMDDLRADGMKQREAVRERWLAFYDSLNGEQKEKARLFFKSGMERMERMGDRAKEHRGRGPAARDLPANSATPAAKN